MPSQVKLEFLALLAACAFGVSPISAQRITPDSSFEHEATGVAATQNGRIFVNFPRWNTDVPISVAEIARDGSIRAYPDAECNRWRNANKAGFDDRA